MTNEFIVFYLHGFGSSPTSSKGKLLKKAFGDNVKAISLTGSPKKAMAKMRTEIIKSKGRRIVLVGSSLGAFYATYLSAIFDIGAVLINPPSEPWNSIPQFDENYPENWKKELKEIAKLTANGDGNMSFVTVLLGTADLHLDYKVAMKRYMGAKIVLRNDGHLFHKNMDLVVKETQSMLEFSKVFEQHELEKDNILWS